MAQAVVGYATFMNPAKVAEFAGCELPFVPVRVTGYRRFLGVVDLSGKKPEDVFDERGSLRNPSIGVSTVESDPFNCFNAVLYRDVPPEVLARLDKVEAKANFDGLPLDSSLVYPFDDSGTSHGAFWAGREGDEVRIYVARFQLLAPRGCVRLVREDVEPNPEYVAACREAARMHGPGFEETFLKTTYLADKRTPLSETPFA